MPVPISPERIMLPKLSLGLSPTSLFGTRPIRDSLAFAMSVVNFESSCLLIFPKGLVFAFGFPSVDVFVSFLTTPSFFAMSFDLIMAPGFILPSFMSLNNSLVLSKLSLSFSAFFSFLIFFFFGSSPSPPSLFFLFFFL